MNLNLAGKSVLVTAASQGLGKATAKEFAFEEAHVLIASRNEEKLVHAVAEIKKDTGNQNIDYFVTDLTKPEQIRALVAKAVERSGTIDVLINNVGGPPAGNFEDFTDKDWQQAFELNLLSFIRTIYAVLPYMKKQQSGHILNIASSSIKESLENLILSNTFRAGIVGLAKSLAHELGRDKIIINTLGPGRFATERVAMLDQLTAEQMGMSFEELRAATSNSIPLGRYGAPEEFAKIAVFLCSGANTYLSGQALVVDGGKLRAL